MVNIQKLIKESEENQKQQYLTPKFLDLVDNLEGITDVEQLFYMVRFRLQLVQVTLFRQRSLKQHFLDRHFTSELDQAHFERQQRLQRIDQMDGREVKFVCDKRYKINCQFYLIYEQVLPFKQHPLTEPAETKSEERQFKLVRFNMVHNHVLRLEQGGPRKH